MGAIVLGKIHLRWCDHCDLPILEQSICSLCGGKTREVKLTPPGDARPAFEHDLARARRLIDDQFGPGTGSVIVPPGRLVLLNKAPDIDRTDELIVGGKVVGAIRFSLQAGERFLPRPASVSAIAQIISKGYAKIDGGAAEAIRKNSASTLAVGVVDCDPGLQRGFEVIVLDQSGSAVSVGVSKMSAHEMMEHRRGTAIKTRWIVHETPHFSPGRNATWKEAVQANGEVLARRISEAKQFIQEVVKESGLPVAVSYSGGKDSLATLLLVLEARIKPKLLFVDTGLEFKETTENVEMTAEEHGLELIRESAGDSFWRNVGQFGPPAKDFRWCCKTCKLGPATRLIQKNFPRGVLSFIGQRAYESQQRAQKGKVWRNPWTPNQLAASPIQKWTALHVWLYLMSKGAKVNPLYEVGLERIGCFLCPATDLAELRKVRDIAPEYTRWQQYLEEHSRKTGKPEAWLKYDLWRWKRVPKSVLDELGDEAAAREIAAQRGEREGPLAFSGTSGYSPCVEGLSMEGIFSKPLSMDRISNMLNAIGAVNRSPDGNIAEVMSMTVFAEGPVMIKAKDQEDLRRKATLLKEVVFRAVGCAGCGICVARCPTGALRLEGQAIIDEDKCTHCGECLGPCPSVRFREDELDI